MYAVLKMTVVITKCCTGLDQLYWYPTSAVKFVQIEAG